MNSPEEPQYISAAQNEEGSQLITDTDDFNNEAIMSGTRHTNTARQPRHTVTPGIRSTQAIDDTPSVESPTPSLSTKLVTIPDNIDAPHQLTNHFPPLFPRSQSNTGDHSNTLTNAFSPQHLSRVSAPDSNLQTPLPLPSQETATNCETLLQKPIKIT